jgi:hypothetical protein
VIVRPEMNAHGRKRGNLACRLNINRDHPLFMDDLGNRDSSLFRGRRQIVKRTSYIMRTQSFGAVCPWVKCVSSRQKKVYLNSGMCRFLPKSSLSSPNLRQSPSRQFHDLESPVEQSFENMKSSQPKFRHRHQTNHISSSKLCSILTLLSLSLRSSSLKS